MTTDVTMGDAIADTRFASQLQTLEAMKQFLFDEKVQLQPEQLASLDLGRLNNLRFGEKGRSPTEDEWRKLDSVLAAIVPLLTPELRWKLRIKELAFFFRQLPIIALGVAVVAISYYVLYPDFLPAQSLAFQFSYWISLLVWTISQGILGACAFLGVTVVTARTAGQKDSDTLALSIDITDRNILTVRIILGAMFAFLIGLPLAYDGLQTIINHIWSQAKAGEVPNPEATVTDYMYLLAPFMFGFSTSLVLGIFNRIVRAVNTLLGISNDAQTQ